DDAVGKPAHLRLCPYFHQGWDHQAPKARTDSRIPDRATAGQERNVFARAGKHEFSFSETNETVRTERLATIPGGAVSVYNRNPGQAGAGFDDNPAFNRGFTLTIKHPKAGVEFVDAPMANRYTTIIVHFPSHKKGTVYEFSFRYWHGTEK
ncbi:MAG: hypothetical protein HZB26_15115, partial [Candidatus Hydrogenedentes bacterium]|nr:hypothetical protein [Candidatus Hydrogenedentota bacterium]